MIPKDCKRLAEVDFPIAEISRHAVAENKIRHKHPKTLHLWWARRPLASSRAVLLSLLLPDPCDPLCPGSFKEEARRRLREVPGCNSGPTDESLRQALLRFIADIANWGNAQQPTYLATSRALVRSAHAPSSADDAYEAPVVVDPFSGGGSIPLEGLRLGCDVFATDLNSVACSVLKVIIEDVQRKGLPLADDIRQVGKVIQTSVESELAELYPRDPDGSTPIAYLWARTVRCESPHCGAEIPLVRSFWLCRKNSRKFALRYKIDRPSTSTPEINFEIFQPRSETEVPKSLVVGGKATCPCCSSVVQPERVRAQISAERGCSAVTFDEKGRRVAGARMLAVVTTSDRDAGRRYRLPNERDYQAVNAAQIRSSSMKSHWSDLAHPGIPPFPSERLNPIRPSPNARGLSAVTRYGMETFSDLFTARQNIVLASLARQVALLPDDATKTCAALVVSKLADYANSLCRWRATSECADALFGRKAVPMVWDFAEPCSLAGAAGSWDSMLDRSSGGLAAAFVGHAGSVELADAAASPLPDETASVWFTDPPYYDSIPYADLSDFFLVWLKRAMPTERLLQDPFDPENQLSPKTRECVWNRSYSWNGKVKDKSFFEDAIARAFIEGRRVLKPTGVASVVFAHKTTEGWEALLSGAIRAGWTIVGSWPIATEMEARLAARDSAALATSVHLICRPRADDAGVGDWAAVLGELPTRVADWIDRLQREGIRGADLVFACIGPALEIFSRYARVETADGREVKLDEYLAKVWEVVGRSALAQVLGTAEARARNGAAGAIEEDARLTALFLWTMQATDDDDQDGDDQDDEDADDDDDDEGATTKKAKGLTLVFDVVRRFAQPLGIELPKWEGRVIETKKGVVRLLPIDERAAQLFGDEGAQAVASRIESDATLGITPQLTLFPEANDQAPKIRGRGKRGRAVDVSDDKLQSRQEATTLDRVHAAMLLQAGGRTNALRALLKAEQERGAEFLRLANALSALYPKASEEKRLLDAMLLAVPR